jgi:DNA-binding NarL/FixJ family response regulator
MAALHPGEIVTAIPQILLADDQQEILNEISLILSQGFRVIGTVNDGREAVEMATSLCPDVLVLDISMPLVNGIEAAFRLKELGSHTRIIFLTVHADRDFVDAAFSAGALGYVLKSSITTDLVPAIWAVIQDKVFVSPSMQLQ